MTTFSDAFDKEYRRAYRSLFESKNFSDLLCLEDKSPLTRAVYCRRTFDTPTLQPRVPKHLVNSFPWLACEEDINLCGCSVNRSRRVKFPRIYVRKLFRGRRHFSKDGGTGHWKPLCNIRWKKKATTLNESTIVRLSEYFCLGATMTVKKITNGNALLT